MDKLNEGNIVQDDLKSLCQVDPYVKTEFINNHDSTLAMTKAFNLFTKLKTAAGAETSDITSYFERVHIGKYEMSYDCYDKIVISCLSDVKVHDTISNNLNGHVSYKKIAEINTYKYVNVKLFADNAIFDVTDTDTGVNLEKIINQTNTVEDVTRLLNIFFELHLAVNKLYTNCNFLLKIRSV